MTANAYLGDSASRRRWSEGPTWWSPAGSPTRRSSSARRSPLRLGAGRLDQLAGAVVAGHVIECGTQATGGNFSGFRDVDTSPALGFPIAEMAEDGSVVITKHAGTAGRSRSTPSRRSWSTRSGDPPTSAPTCRPGSTHGLDPGGPDRSPSPASSASRPGDDEVCSTPSAGSATASSSARGLTSREGRRSSATGEPRSAAGTVPETVEWQLDRTDTPDPATEARAPHCCGATSRARRRTRSAGPLSDAAIQLALASYPGFSVTRPPSAGTPYGIYRPAYVPQSEVPHVVVHADGRREDIDPPSTVSSPRGRHRVAGGRRAGVASARRRLGGRDRTSTARDDSHTRAPATRAATPTSACGSLPAIRLATTRTRGWPGSSTRRRCAS